MTLAFTLFDTPIGVCAVAWRGERIAGTQLPLPDAIDLSHRMRRRFPEADETPPPAHASAAIAAMRALLSGERRDLSDIPLDMDETPDFHCRVYERARAIPPGETRSYGDIARALGDVALSREVGQALGLNPFPIIVPCHRVLGSNGKAGGFSANGGVETKMRMLSIERARTSDAPSLFEDLPLAAPPRRAAP